MGQDFYTQWLGIAPGPRPPDYYTLLGLERFCQDVEAIESATRARLTRLDEFAMHPDRDTRDAVQDMMNEVARARVCLVNPAKRMAYDQQLRGGAAAPAGAAQAAAASAPAAPRREPVFAQDEPALAGTAPPGLAPGAEAAIRRFEALVWKHLGKWKLGPQEERLLVAEAADLGIAADAARRIIRKIDRAAEDRADRRHKWTVGIVVASAVLIVAGFAAWLLISDWQARRQRDTQAKFTAAISAVKDSLARGDLNGADAALAKAKAVLPQDPRLAEAGRAMSAARAKAREDAARAEALKDAARAKAREDAARAEALKDALAKAGDCLARGDIAAAEDALAHAKALAPDAPQLSALAAGIARARAVAAQEKALADALADVRTCLVRNDLPEAEKAIAKAKDIAPLDKRVASMDAEFQAAKAAEADRQTQRLAQRDRARSLIDAGKYGEAKAVVDAMLATQPDDPPALKLKAELDGLAGMAECMKVNAETTKLMESWPEDPASMTPAQKAEAAKAAEAVKEALALAPANKAALDLKAKLDKFLSPTTAVPPVVPTTHDPLTMGSGSGPADAIRKAWSDASQTNYLLADVALTTMANRQGACRLAGEKCPATELIGKVLAASSAAERIGLLVKTATSTADPNADLAKPKTAADYRRMLSKGTRLQQWEAIEGLQDLNTAEAAAALLEHVEAAAKAAKLSPQIASACQALRALVQMTDKSIPDRLINAMATCPNDVFAYHISGALAEGFSNRNLGGNTPSDFALNRDSSVNSWRIWSRRCTWNRTPVAARARPAPLSSKPRSYSALESGAAALLLVAAADNAEAMKEALRTVAPAGKPPLAKPAPEPSAGEAFVTACQAAANELGRIARGDPAAAKFVSQLDSIAEAHKARTLACVSHFQQAAVAMDTQGAYLAVMVRMLDAEGKLAGELNDLAQRRSKALAGATSVLLEMREAGYYNLLLWDMLLQCKGVKQ
jgi:hypothetical protein